jgi:sulfite exporter TauE/SafE
MRYLLMLLSGLAFSGHCVGMCGLFPAALGGAGGRRAARPHGAYHAGRIATYAFLGVLAAAAGLRLQWLQRPLGVAAGVLLIAVGAAAIAPAAAPRWLVRLARGSPLCGLLAGLLRDGRPVAALSAGVFNGFVPCALVYAMAAHAATLGSIPAAALGMAAFGLGTVPALAAAGVSLRLAAAGAARLPWAPAALRAAGLVTVALGVLTLWRAAASGASHLGHAG